VLGAYLGVLELSERKSPLQTLQTRRILERVYQVKLLLENLPWGEADAYLERATACHSGYQVTVQPISRSSEVPAEIAARVATALNVSEEKLLISPAALQRSDFSYAECRGAEMEFPVSALVLSVQLASGEWLNAEIHAHESHWNEKLGWLWRATLALIVTGVIAHLLIRRVTRPLERLAHAARRFGASFEQVRVPESGPIDARVAIASFNRMQERVAQEFERRRITLASIAHDVRSPLTAIRMKAELVQDDSLRRNLVTSIERMSVLVEKSLEFLKEESNEEAFEAVDLVALVESECSEFSDAGSEVEFDGSGQLICRCRHHAVARAVRNLIENAIRYASSARVDCESDRDSVCITVEDPGPGIPNDKLKVAQEPFYRVSAAREDGGFGLGLAIVKSVADGHGGTLELRNTGAGFRATLRLPREPR
ncbi:MAG: ATP-binding protein, partial [Myxococcota bacterium]